MALLALAGMDYRAILRSGDPVEVQVAQAVAERALTMRAKIEGTRAKALAHNIGVNVANNLAKILRG